MLKASAIKENRLIRFITEDYKDLFYLPDGAKLTLTYPDSSTITKPCKYIGSHHFYFGTNCYHIAEFAELMARNHVQLQPHTFVTTPEYFEKKYPDRALKDEAGRLIPYREFYTLEDRQDPYRLPMLSIAWCPVAAPEREYSLMFKAQNNTDNHNYTHIFTKRGECVNQLLAYAADKDLSISRLDLAFIEAFIQANSREQTKPKLCDRLSSLVRTTETQTSNSQPEIEREI